MERHGDQDLDSFVNRMKPKKSPGLSRFFSFLEFSVIYWIRNNFLILCYVLFVFSYYFLSYSSLDLFFIGALDSWIGISFHFFLINWSVIQINLCLNLDLFFLVSFELLFGVTVVPGEPAVVFHNHRSTSATHGPSLPQKWFIGHS